jgi:hypothetical protein
VRDALAGLASREGGGDEQVARAQAWLERDEREQRNGAIALVLELLGERRLLASVRAHDELLAYLDEAMAAASGAARAESRSDARRRLLAALPRALATAVAHVGPRAQDWLAAACAEAAQPDLRAALSDTVILLRSPAFGQSPPVAERLQASLSGSAKPLRDPTRLRPGTGRGKASRRTR